MEEERNKGEAGQHRQLSLRASWLPWWGEQPCTLTPFYHDCLSYHLPETVAPNDHRLNSGTVSQNKSFSLVSRRDLVTVTKDKQTKQNTTPTNTMIVLIMEGIIGKSELKHKKKKRKKKTAQYSRFPTNASWRHSITYPAWFLEWKSTIHVFLVANSLKEHNYDGNRGFCYSHQVTWHIFHILLLCAVGPLWLPSPLGIS